jgi:GDPmannose 4,6-dehydratase
MWMMLQQDKPDDFVIGTGETHSIREFLEVAISTLGMEGRWEGSGVDEQFVSGDKVIVKVNPEFYRPAEVDVLIADARKAYEVLNWIPSIDFKTLVKRMVNYDCKL